ncbi:hypothetical protein EV13_1507 [Prochlorococcus sp. MIT 0702]|nr:hypothetical protein EV13_1507 [Prochlorococcus sp. MIT 0702]KGG29200.1 hypothetical protein EV12_0251 [Prochlorococcus sp. MIT 0701]KGG34497.1 hypothetical protein EV14_1179 [Prochlorococcus sp. MIT 0703]
MIDLKRDNMKSVKPFGLWTKGWGYSLKRRSSALAAALSLLPLGQPLLLGTLGITTATTAVVLQQTPAIAQDASAVARIAKAITVRIEGATQGSGVLVKREGNRYTVLTAWHVVSGNRPGEELAIFTPDGKEHQLEQGSVERLGQVDMAVLTFSSPGAYEVANVGDVNSVSSGNPIFVSGFPLPTSAVPTSIWRFLDGKLIANATVAIPNGYQLLYSNPTLPGMSGGSVLNRQGKLVGIHGRSEKDDQVSMSTGKAVSTGINQAVPISYYKQFDTGQAVVASRTQATSADDYLAQAEKVLGNTHNKVYGNWVNEEDGLEIIRLANKALELEQSAMGFFLRAYVKQHAYRYDKGKDRSYKLYDDHDAIADYDKAIAIDGSHKHAFLYRGNARLYGDLQDYGRAISDYNAAIEIDSLFAKAYFMRAQIKETLKDYQGALYDYTKVIEIEPRNAYAFKERGRVRHTLGDKEGGDADWRKAVEIDPYIWGA